MKRPMEFTYFFALGTLADMQACRSWYEERGFHDEAAKIDEAILGLVGIIPVLKAAEDLEFGSITQETFNQKIEAIRSGKEIVQ